MTAVATVPSTEAAAPALDAPTTTPADLGAELSYLAAGGGCEVDEVTGALTIVGADSTEAGSERNCVVTLSAVKSGYGGSDSGPCRHHCQKSPG